jgi:hypothetical protein
MTGKYPPPMVTITLSQLPDLRRRSRGSRSGVVRCPTYSQALRWARLECKSYEIPEPIIDFPDNDGPNDVVFFGR